MCELINETSLTAAVFPGLNQQGKPQMTCVIKAGFSYNLQGECQQLNDVEIIVGDRWVDVPGESSLQFADETMPFKYGAEILLSGTAHSIHATTSLDVVLQLQRSEQQWRKSLRVFGKRVWQRRRLSLKASSPELFQQLPLRYENAFGGVDAINSAQHYSYNPIGKGFSSKAVVGVALPEIELPPPLITSPMQIVQSAGFGPIPIDWQPRATILKKLPYKYPHLLNDIIVPADFYNVSPVSQRFTKPFVGGEQVTLLGLTQGVQQAINFLLPTVKFSAQLFTEHDQQPLSPNCDTLVIDADRQQFFMLWRIAMTNESSQYLLLHE